MSGPVDIVCRPIGVVRSRFSSVLGMPIQTAAAGDETAEVELFPQYAAGLRDVEGLDYLILVTHFHQCREERLEVLPFLDSVSHGVFATRAPSRPNRLGLSIVKLERVAGLVLHVRGNDMLEGTPVVDIKPYVPAFDVRSTDRIGWLTGQIDRLPGIRSDDRMS